ncbi:MAG TPA: hypothetical protein VH500_18965 [Nitrososphaeraceae archaeon]|jgi:hypothetical protein
MLTPNSIPLDRINNQIRGRIIGKSFENALHLVNKYGGVSKPGEHGSIYGSLGAHRGKLDVLTRPTQI